MIEKDFKIDFKSKKVGYNSKGSGETYTVNKLYSLIMDLLDEPENMKYDIPVESVAKGGVSPRGRLDDQREGAQAP